MSQQPSSEANLVRRAMDIHQRLLSVFGEPSWGVPAPPIEELVSTILSQNTNDLNRDRAYRSLRAHFPTWEEVRDAPPQAVIEAIRSAGLSNLKGPRIQTALKSITAQRGRLELDFLRELPPNEVRQWLLQFNGVGPKTAAIVMLFSLDMPAFPVDTHIYRVTGRLGLRPAGMSVEETHQRMESLLPPETFSAGHLNLIRLGREVCHPRKPDCPACPLLDLCGYGQEQVRAGFTESSPSYS